MNALLAMKHAVDCWECEQMLTDAVVTNLRTAIEEMEKAEPVALVVDAGGNAHFPKLQWTSANTSLETPIGSKLYTHPAPIPEGWQLVPVELLRILKHYTSSHLFVHPTCGAPTDEEVEAALAAAPKPEDET